MIQEGGTRRRETNKLIEIYNVWMRHFGPLGALVTNVAAVGRMLT